MAIRAYTPLAYTGRLDIGACAQSLELHLELLPLRRLAAIFKQLRISK